MRPGDRVQVRPDARGTNFVGMRGVIVAVGVPTPADAQVHLDGERKPMTFGLANLVIDNPEPHMVAGE